MNALSRRTLARGTAGVLGGTALARCGPFTGGTDGAGSTLAGPATAKVLTFNNPLFQGARDDLLSAVAEADPGLRPDLIVFPGQINEFRVKALAMYAGGDIPDAQWIHPSITSLLAARKLARPLDELARRDRATALGEFYPALLDHFRWKGGVYGLPWYSPGWAFVFNRTLFERLGVAPPDRVDREQKWTWDTFVATLRRLTTGTPGSPDRTIGSHAHSMALDWACAWLWRHGGDVFSKDGRKCLLNEPAAVAAIQDLADLHLRYQVINYGPHQEDFREGFNSGRIGLRQANKEQVSPERNDLSRDTFSLGMAPVYKGPAGRVNRLGTLAFGAAHNGPNGDAGWRWVRYMAGAPAAAILMKRKSTLPVRPKYAQMPEYAQSTEPWEQGDVWLESQATARAIAQPASYQDIATLWDGTWAEILAQKGPVKALLDDLVRQVNPLLAQEET